MVAKGLTQIEAEITRLFNQFLINIQYQIVFCLTIAFAPGGMRGGSSMFWAKILHFLWLNRDQDMHFSTLLTVGQKSTKHGVERGVKVK